MFRFVLIVTSIMLALDLVWWWRGDAWARKLPNRRAWRIGWATFMLAQTAGILLLMSARYIGLDRTAGLPTGVLIFIFVWHLLVLPATVMLALLVNAGWSFARLIGLIRSLFSPSPIPMGEGRGEGSSSAVSASQSPKNPHPDPLPAYRERGEAGGLSRRRFIAAAVVGVPPLVTIVGSGWAIPQVTRFRIRRVTIPLASLPRDLDGLTIAHVADIHVGDFTQGQTLRDIVNATNQLKPDLVLMTGDLLNRRLSDLPAAIDMVRRFDPKHGLFNVQGNHDLFEGRDAFNHGVRAGGVPLLVDESQTIHINGHPLQILGLQWGRRRGADSEIDDSVARLLQQRRPDAFPILLAHHPHAFDRAAIEKVPLTLAGHTHGGQLHLTPGIGFGPWMFKYWSGLYRKGDSALVVSNGVGNWFPLRVNAPAEIVHITLRRDA